MRTAPAILLIYVFLAVVGPVVAAPQGLNPFKSKKEVTSSSSQTGSVVAAQGFNPFKSKKEVTSSSSQTRAKVFTNFDIDVFHNNDCKTTPLGTLSGEYHARTSESIKTLNANCAVIYKLPSQCVLQFHSNDPGADLAQLRGPKGHPQGLRYNYQFDKLTVECD